MTGVQTCALPIFRDCFRADEEGEADVGDCRREVRECRYDNGTLQVRILDGFEYKFGIRGVFGLILFRWQHDVDQLSDGSRH